MSDVALESRVGNLEQQAAELVDRVLSPPAGKTRRSKIGMFDGDAMMCEINEEGRKIRAADREQSNK